MIADPRLKLIARDLQTLPAIVTACAALMKDIPDLEAVAEFLDLPLGVIQQIAHELKARKVLKKSATAEKAARGTRLTKDWKLPRAFYNYALSYGYTHEQVMKIAEEFRNHWVSDSSSKAVKLDWEATWRNRIIYLAEKAGKHRAPDNSLFDGDAPAAQPTSMWKQAMSSWMTNRTWVPSLGPAPGEPGCKVPADVLAEFRA